MATYSSIKVTINGVQYTLNETSAGTFACSTTAPTITSYNVNAGHYYPVTLDVATASGLTASYNDSSTELLDGTSTTIGSKLRFKVEENTAPVVTFSSPAPNVWINNDKIYVVFTITDEVNGSGVNESASFINIYNSSSEVVFSKCVNDSTITATSVANGKEYSIPWRSIGSLADGTYSIVITAKDYDNNTTSTGNTRAFTIDTGKPTLTLNYPVDMTYLGGTSNTLNISGSTNDTLSGKTVTISYEILRDGGGDDADETRCRGDISVNGNTGEFAKSFTVGSDLTLANGFYLVIVSARDRAGNVTEEARNVVIDDSTIRIKNVTIMPNPADCGETYTITVEVE